MKNRQGVVRRNITKFETYPYISKKEVDVRRSLGTSVFLRIIGRRPSSRIEKRGRDLKGERPEQLVLIVGNGNPRTSVCTSK